MSDFWDILTFLWESVFNFLNTSVVTIGSVNITLWELALGFTLFSMVLTFVCHTFDDN